MVTTNILMNFSRLMIRLLVSFFVLCCLYSCESSRDELPNCHITTERVEIPNDFELIYYPYIEIKIHDKTQYLLQDKMINSGVGTCNEYGPECIFVATHLYDEFFQLNFARPQTLRDLNQSIGIRTPLISLDSLLKKDTNIVHVGLTFFDTCGNAYQPIQTTSESNFNIISQVSEVERNDLPSDGKDVELIETLVSGTLNAQFLVNDEIVPVQMNYKLTEYIIQLR